MKSQERMKFWQRHVTASALFDGSVKRYCERERISHSSFYQWRRNLKFKPSSSKWSSPRAPSMVGRPTLPFAAVEIVQAASRRPPQETLSSLPDPRWVAAFVLELHQGLRR